MTEDVKDEDLKINEQDDGSVTIGDAPAAPEEDERLANTDDHDDEQHSDEDSEECLLS